MNDIYQHINDLTTFKKNHMFGVVMPSAQYPEYHSGTCVPIGTGYAQPSEIEVFFYMTPDGMVLIAGDIVIIDTKKDELLPIKL